MAMRCLGHARLGVGTPRLALMVFRAMDLAAVLPGFFRAGDFFIAAVFAAARAVGFLLAMEAVSFRVVGEKLAGIAICEAFVGCCGIIGQQRI